jgi:squalene-hopene/tetraprenyl-beta-curcumene cyclase
MALASIRRKRSEAEKQVIDEGVRFIVNSVRPDGSWPIDTNLATWVTTLSVNALAAADDLKSLDTKDKILAWLLKQQYKERHPYTGADPGGWAWTDLPGGVPDCDDTPGAIMAIAALDATNSTEPAQRNGCEWLRDLQNQDDGFPTFCRGWGTLPFDRSGCDLTAHVIRALVPSVCRTKKAVIPAEWAVGAAMPAIKYLAKQQREDGSWLPLWFGNQHSPDDINPVYGTARVLAAYRDLRLKDSPECQRGVTYLLSVQNADGGWGGAKDCPSSVEETALAVEVLLDLANNEATQHGVAWLVEAVESGRFRDASPIGFYFAKLWYFEKLYPLIFTMAALGRATGHFTSSAPAEGSA